MLRLITLTLLAAIAAPASFADEQVARNRGQSVSDCGGCASRYQIMDDERRDRYRECHARAADRGLHDASRRQYIEDCVSGRLERRTLVMLGG